MPPPVDYRDHPEKYQTGDYPTTNRDALLSRFPKNARVYFGDVRETVRLFLEESSPEFTIGFISVDIDYYSSTKACLEVLRSDQRRYLPSVPMYFDDVYEIDHNDYCGERLAIREFNASEDQLRKIVPMTGLRDCRLFKNAAWLNKMYFAHVFDSERRKKSSGVSILDNPYLHT